MNRFSQSRNHSRNACSMNLTFPAGKCKQKSAQKSKELFWVDKKYVVPQDKQ